MQRIFRQQPVLEALFDANPSLSIASAARCLNKAADAAIRCSNGAACAQVRSLGTSAAQPAPSSTGKQSQGQLQMPFQGILTNNVPDKPRSTGLTEIRGPYYTPMGKHYLQDLLDSMGHACDGLKFAGGAFRVMKKQSVQDLIKIAHEHGLYVSTGGWMEYVLTQGKGAVRDYIKECKELGFDVIELSTGFISLPTEDLVELVKDVTQAGLKAKPEVGIQFGAGGASGAAALEAEGTIDPTWAITKAKRCLDAGAHIIMVESEGITEDVNEWRTDVAARFINELGLDKVMFEAADPAVFAWYMKTYGPRVNLFVDHSQIVELECLRRGIWGTSSLWGRVLTYDRG